MEIADNSAIPLLVLTRQQDHVEIINSTLRKAGHAVHCHWIPELNDLSEALTQINAQMVMAYVATDAEATAALQLLKQCAPKLPVLLMREQVDEDMIAKAMQLGARDVVTLNHPARLQAVATRELHAYRLERSLSTTVSAAREYREQLKSFMAGSADAIAHVQEGILIDANPAWLELFGHPNMEAIVGQPLMDSFEADSHAALKGALAACLQGKWQNHSLKTFGVPASGDALPLELQFELVEIEGEPAIQLSIAAHKEDDRALDQQLSDALERDASTGLLQRRCFMQRLETALAQPAKAGVRVIACIEPDQFGALEDKLGPSAVEDFVAQFAELLKESLQPEHLSGRFGDSRFLVLLERGTRGDVDAWCAALLRKVAGHVFSIGDKSLSITCAIGLGLIDANDKRVDAPLIEATHARQLAAERGGNRIHIIEQVNDETRSQANDQVWVKHIKAALMENRFRLLQQPIASLMGDEKGMYDVLVRMVDEQGKEILPSEFITAAERNDLMKNIDRWVVGAAMSFCGSRPVQRLFVRLSKDSVLDKSLPQWLANQLKATRIDPSRIAFELSEQVVGEHLSQSIQLITVLRRTGFKFAIEHFGAARDSVRLLEQLPVEYIKIDGTLMQGVAMAPDLQERVRAIVDTAKAKKIATIAERVEDANTMAVLWQLGIEFIQGYFVNEPEQVTMGA